MRSSGSRKPPSATLISDDRVSSRAPSPPARIAPRPKRLPQRRIDVLMAVVRSRPYVVAPWRKPMSDRHPREAGEVHRDALELEHHAACGLDVGSRFPAPASASIAAAYAHVCAMLVSPAIVSTSGASLRGSPREQQLLDAAVLVAEVDLEVMHLLAEAHEAEAPGLDDAGVDGADGDLVHLLALDLVEAVRVAARCAGVLEANRLHPRMPGDAHAVLLVELTLEAVQRRDTPA